MPAVQVQELAAGAVADGFDVHPEIRALGALGAHGDYPGNVARDLNQLYRHCRKGNPTILHTGIVSMYIPLHSHPDFFSVFLASSLVLFFVSLSFFMQSPSHRDTSMVQTWCYVVCIILSVSFAKS